MLSTLEWVLLVSALIIIAALATYAGYLLSALKKQNQQQAQAQLEQQQALYQHDKKVLTSVVHIVRAMIAEQCEVSEGCWRICVLMASLKTSSNHQQSFPAIFALYDAIKDLSILDARKQLAKQARMKEDLIRTKAEAQYTEAVNQELPKLLDYANGLIAQNPQQSKQESEQVIVQQKLH